MIVQHLACHIGPDPRYEASGDRLRVIQLSRELEQLRLGFKQSGHLPEFNMLRAFGRLLAHREGRGLLPVDSA